MPLSHCVSCGIADYRCYTPTSFRKDGISQAKERFGGEASQKKLASAAYSAIGGVARNSIANRTIVGLRLGLFLLLKVKDSLAKKFTIFDLKIA